MTRRRDYSDGPGALGVELVPIDSVKLDSRNARRHNVPNIDAIKISLRAHGQRKPIVITRRARQVAAGNGTVIAARELGWTELWATVYPGTLNQARAYAIADNHAGDLSTWDDAQLADTLSELESLDPALLNAATFTDDLLHALARTLDRPAPALDPADPPAPAEDDTEDVDEPTPEARYADRVKHPRTAEGDVWHLGAHRLVCGDSFEPSTIDALLGTKRVHCVLTDPPYAIYGSSQGIGADVADDRMVRPFFASIFRVVAARVRTFGHVYVHCDWRSWAALVEGARVGGVTIKNMIVWDKLSSGMGNMYSQGHELVAFLVLEPPPKAMNRKQTGHRTVLRPNIVRNARASGHERQHNAAKPVELLTEFLTNSTDKGHTVLDLFGGSGSTLIACEQLDRVAYVSEQDPRWCDVIAERWQRATGRLPVLHRGGESREVDLSAPLTRPPKTLADV